MGAFLVVFFALLAFAILGGSEAQASIHAFHEGLFKVILIGVVVACVVFIGAGLFSLGAKRVLGLVFLLAMVALVVFVALPVGRLIVFSHPFGPVAGLAFIGVILIKALSRGGD